MQLKRQSGNGEVADTGVLVDLAHLKLAQALIQQKQIIDETGTI